MRQRYFIAFLFSALLIAQTTDRSISNKPKFCADVHSFAGEQFDVAYWKQSDSESNNFRDVLRQTLTSSSCGWIDTNAPEYDLRLPLKGIVVHYATRSDDDKRAAEALVAALTAQGLKMVKTEALPDRTNPGLSIFLGTKPK